MKPGSVRIAARGAGLQVDEEVVFGGLAKDGKSGSDRQVAPHAAGANGI